MLSTGTAQASLKAGALEVGRSSSVSQWLMAVRKLFGMWQSEDKPHLNLRCPCEAVLSFQAQSR